ncbi:MAG: MBL fold metallo-hydrolase [Candidatus Kapaibacterium sp.]
MSEIKRDFLKFTVLGSGTSSGIPTISCNCETCTSADPRDKRLRCSLLVESPSTSIVIDTSPDFRQQMLRCGVKKLDAVIFTHHHFDHIGGFDDIRAFNFTSGNRMPIFLNEKTFKELKRTFIYAFEEPEQRGGGVPLIDINILNGCKFSVGDIELIPIPVLHGKLVTLGFRIGRMAYITDVNNIPPESMKNLKGLKYLIIDALRFNPHPTHFCVDEATNAALMIGAEITYFTHMAHQIKHEELESKLPENIFLAYDGLVLET